ncbi:dienelactone hydrolase family protein [Aestuariirhabdus sp. Z084]|uniref:dienelactone hydrolase family protein n=1 Tax=Aestuariirhabdus haliotis TaxID=2918751 RepID=UPI00201B461D|nr:dienelactone hydrolase family protein [Aestuariirhabdus haliotis]MCL6414352.1 dienelactone hydrolase family protein [Aestuariirhabdus haliotis]MCL6418284.1 dienelactone hydrolase family protein [Aestuariirhabdus haliotis]
MKTLSLWKLLLLMLLLMAVAIAVYGWPYRNAIFVTPKSGEQIAAELTPYFQLFKPEGKGPFPAVAVFHGCAGPEADLSLPRAAWLTRQGYVALLVDSFTGRGYQRSDVCSGTRFWGNQRVADVYAALSYLRDQPEVDGDNLALLGYSHGGWTLLDALAYDDERPIGALQATPGGLRGVKAVVAYYPYCEFPAHSATGWKANIPVLGLLAGQDSVVDVEACLRLFERMQAENKALDYELYAQAEHVFDAESRPDYYDPVAANKALQVMADFLERQLASN